MNSILIIDDMALFRGLLATVFQAAGYTTFEAKDGRQGLQKLREHRPDLVLLDLMMPVLDGMGFIRAMRRDHSLTNVPVILLTELMDKKYVMEAATLGVRDYLLKSSISFVELCDRINRLLSVKSDPNIGVAKTSASSSPQKIHPAAAVAITQTGASQPNFTPGGAGDLTQLMNSRQCIQRVEACMAGKTLSGAVAEVMMLAGRPSAELKDLSHLITRDPVLSVRVLQMANSAAFFSRRGTVTTINEAVKNIGATNVRNIAASVGVFDAMPASSQDGFNPIRCWQHSFAVARLCEAFVAPTSPAEAGIAYLTGLCHDLGEIMFRTQFEKEYQTVLDEQQRTAAPLEEIERRLLGMTHTEILKVILKCMGLPDTIRDPIERFQRAAKPNAAHPLVLRALSMAETYANGLLLVSSAASSVMPFTRKDWSALSGQTKLAIPDGEEIRSQVYCLTAILSRLNSADQAELLKSPFKKADARVWLARDPMFADADPVTAALGEIANVEVHDRLPTPAELDSFSCLALEGSTGRTPGWSLTDIGKSREANVALPVLWLVNEEVTQSGADAIEPMNFVSIQIMQDTISQAAKSTI